MRMVYMDQERDCHSFAIRAAIHFSDHKEHFTYTDGDIEPGCLFAMRYGLGDDCVVVLKLDCEFVPVNFQQLIREYAIERESLFAACADRNDETGPASGD